MQRFQRELPLLVLGAAALSSQFIEAPLKWFSETKVVARNRQYVPSPFPYGIEHPIRKFYFNFLHSSLTGLTNDLRAGDKSEDTPAFNAAGCDVGFDLRSLEAREGGFQSLVSITAGFSVRGSL